MGNNSDKPNTAYHNSNSFFDVDREFHLAAFRPVSSGDVQALGHLHPFLEIMGCQADGQPYHVAKPESLPEGRLDAVNVAVPTYVLIESQWNIQYWPGAASWPPVMSASPGRQVYYGDQPTFNEVDLPVGTLHSQAIEVSVFMVLLARQQQWPGIHIVSAEANMRWAAWMIADHLGIPCFGFEADTHDRARQKRVIPLLAPYLSETLTYTVSDVYVPEVDMSEPDIDLAESVVMPVSVQDRTAPTADQALKVAEEFGDQTTETATDEPSQDSAASSED